MYCLKVLKRDGQELLAVPTIDIMVLRLVS